MTTFTKLEAAVLKLVCETEGKQLSASQRELLAAHLATAKVVKRDNTGHGFYTTFEVDHGPVPRLECLNMIDAPTVSMVGLGEDNSLGFILWAEDGYPTTLEGYQNGDVAGGTVDLLDYDLAELRFSGASWF